jgi:cellulose synthase/poly-beta-1,6-N-acetylglucosamine synthase-like glycosyltransferase
MLIHALELTGCWLAISTLALVLFGRRMRGTSIVGAFVWMLVIEALGALAMLAAGMPRRDVAITSAAVLALALLLMPVVPAWNAVGRAAWVFFVAASVAYLSVALVIILSAPANLGTMALGLMLLAMQLIGIILTLSYSFELLDVVCRRRWRHPEGRPPRLIAAARGSRPDREAPVAEPAMGAYPSVALHVPCHNEPVEVVEQTLHRLARIDYPRDRYQVIVVDNNTEDPALWQPVEALCQRLGFVFLHLEQWPGFKSGALNYALATTPLQFDLIGVVDADYLVAPEYLRELVGHFEDEWIAFVQTPQDYRDYQADSTFYQRACYHAYRYFFDLSMPSRNERNAIIFGGTMGLIRASALREIGGWDEWCITEDAEASLRLLARGYEGIFVNRSYGWGLMPLEFDALKRQRFRWCFGGIQILRKHWYALLPWSRRLRPTGEWEMPGLSAAQRYHYLFGGLQWYGDALNLGFTTLLLLTGTLAVTGHAVRLPILGGPLVLLPLLFWATSLGRTLWGLRATRTCTWGEAIGAVAVLWSLSWVVTLASLQGAIRRQGVFLRTPKDARANWLRALRSTTMETLLGGLCWSVGAALISISLGGWLARARGQASLGHALADLSGGGLWWRLGTSRLSLTVFALLQGAVYLTAPVLCLLSLRSEPAARAVRRRAYDGEGANGVVERRLLVGAGAVVAVLAALLVLGVTQPQSAPPVLSGQGSAISSLLGTDNALPTPAATATPPGVGPGTPTATGSPLPGSASPTPFGTPTNTPHPGATVTPASKPTVTPVTRPPTPTPRH